MILLLVIVQSEDAGKLSDRLLEADFRLTRIDAKGGFLAVGNSVLLIGIDEDHLPAITAIIAETCQTRTRWENAAPWPGMAGVGAMGLVEPMEVIVGGAVVFGVPVEQFLRFAAAGDGDGDSREIEALALASQGKAGTRLVVAIVQNEGADAVVGGLMAAGYRLTRINTAGGFLRRGNATLLIGVEAHRLHDVLGLIQTCCHPRSKPAPVRNGMPMYSATVFVLDTAHFLRF